jgi:hypothetical protein
MPARGELSPAFADLVDDEDDDMGPDDDDEPTDIDDYR